MSPSGTHDHSPSRGPSADWQEAGLVDDDVAELVRLAGPRPAVPAADEAIVREAALATWERTVAWRRRRRVAVGVGGGLLAAALVIFALRPLLVPDAIPAQPVATVVALAGAVSAEDGPLTVGSTIDAGSVLDTGDGVMATRIAIRLATGTEVRLDRGTRARLVSNAEISLERGAVYADTGLHTHATENLLAVHTPRGVVRDIGTRFEVRLGGAESALRVLVRDGAVTLDQGGQVHRADAGESLSLGEDGALHRGPIAAHHEAWAWTHTVAAPFDIEGRNLRALLDWAAHEGGWVLRFATPALAARADTTMLYGSIEGLDLEDAITTYLAGAELRYALDDGALVIEGAGD